MLSITSLYHSFLIRDGHCLEYSEEDQAICAVGLAKSKPGVFVEAIQYLLILATPVQVLSYLYQLSPFLLAICEFGVTQIYISFIHFMITLLTFFIYIYIYMYLRKMAKGSGKY